MKKLTLHDKHIEFGAKMVPYAGYQMPIQYEGVMAEHNTVRNDVGVFDVSHMGEFIVYGHQALDLLQMITTNDVSKLTVGRAQYSCMLTEDGGIIDDLIVYKMNAEEYMLVVNAANIDKNWKWINSKNTVGASIKNISDEYSLLAIQGPKAIKVLQRITSKDLSFVPFYNFIVGDFAGKSDIIISATGYTGSGGFEIYCPNVDVVHIWEEIFFQGKDYDIKPIGLGARDTLRLEMGYCLFGNDIDETVTPIEAGLGWVVKFNKHFIGRKQIEIEKKTGVSRKLVAFSILNEKGIPRKGYAIEDKYENIIGRVTSGTQSPCLKQGIGMGYVFTEHTNVGTEVWINIRNKRVKATVVKLPFYKKEK